MRVVHFSTADRGDEASVAAYRLHTAMCRYGVDSHMLVVEPSVTDLSVWPTRPLDRLKIRLSNWWHEGELQKMDRRYHMRLDLTGIDPLSYPIVRNSDAYLVHATGGGFLGTAGLQRLLGTGKPVYLFLHDLAPLTGGCGCYLGCPSFTSGCDHCPAKGGSRVQRAARKKRETYLFYPNLTLVAPSEWTRQQLLGAWVGGGLDATVVPCSLDTELFAPHQRLWTRWLFGIPKKAKCLLFVGDTKDPIKGWNLLRDALVELIPQEWTVVVLGAPSLKGQELPFRHKRLIALEGTRNAPTLAALYNAVDLTVVPSLMECAGQVAVESLCCGTPVVGYQVAALPELVENGVNGYLAKGSSLRDICVTNLSGALRQQMAHLLSDKERLVIAEAMARRVDYGRVVPPLIKRMEESLGVIGNK